MESSLVAAATTAGKLFSGSTFEVPPYQREYAWGPEEIQDFWEDLRAALSLPEYFLGLIILTDDGHRRHIVDGQQRLLSITLLAAALTREALRRGRKALAERIQNTFLTSIDYETDEEVPRLVLTDAAGDQALRSIISSDISSDSTTPPKDSAPVASRGDIAANISKAHDKLLSSLQSDLSDDPFRRLGIWAEFLTDKLFMAVFVHPDASSAYRVFEVVNTRGRDLTTADLLKNYAISQAPPDKRDARHKEWQSIAKPLRQPNPNALVQYIRHITTLHSGHVLPRDLFDFLASRSRSSSDKRQPPTIDQLMTDMAEFLPLYLQMIDPTLDGPAQPEWLAIFDAFNRLGVVTVRPLLLAISTTSDSTDGMEEVLRLVVRRIVVGNLGTGNVERRFADAAWITKTEGDWHAPLAALADLNPPRTEFESKASSRSFSKATLSFLRSSELQKSITPDAHYLHLIRPRQASDWPGFPADEFTYWGSTLGNTVIAKDERRPKNASTWRGFKEQLLPQIEDLDRDELDVKEKWKSSDVEERSLIIAKRLASIWFGE